MDSSHIPILQKLIAHQQQAPISFHTPGHKNGAIFPKEARSYFQSILPLDMTELPGLDDLHGPHGMIREAEEQAASFFQADHTFFLVNGSTVGNLAMLLATCGPGDGVIVQRNCHKSVMNGLELSGARPIFIAPDFDDASGLYVAPDLRILKEALQRYPSVKAVVLTYPDYFGKTFAIKEMIDLIHAYHIPVLVDEAHGVHFSVPDARFPTSSIVLGADAVVQSAHKIAPAMTMASYLHVNANAIEIEQVAHYLQILQSSSPSYPLLASLDIARAFLQKVTSRDIREMIYSADELRRQFRILSCVNVVNPLPDDDPLKIILRMKRGHTGKEVAALFEKEGVYPELATDTHILLIHGLAPFTQLDKMKTVIKNVQEKLKSIPYRDIIETRDIFTTSIGELALTYKEMKATGTKHVAYEQAAGYVAAEAIIPYPPGIPILLRGERVNRWHLQQIKQLHEHGVTIQMRNKTNQISVFEEGTEDM